MTNPEDLSEWRGVFPDELRILPTAAVTFLAVLIVAISFCVCVQGAGIDFLDDIGCVEFMTVHEVRIPADLFFQIYRIADKSELSAVSAQRIFKAFETCIPATEAFPLDCWKRID